jgi:hypothetical protein
MADGLGEGFSKKFLPCDREERIRLRTLGNPTFYSNIVTVTATPFTYAKAADFITGYTVVTSAGTINIPSASNLLRAMQQYAGENNVEISSILQDGVITSITNNGMAPMNLVAGTGVTFAPTGATTYSVAAGETVTLKVMPVDMSVGSEAVLLQPIFGGGPIPPLRLAEAKYFIPPEDEITTFSIPGSAWTAGFSVVNASYLQFENNNVGQCDLRIQLPLRFLWEQENPYAFSLVAINVYVAPFGGDLVQGNPDLILYQITYNTSTGNMTTNAIPGAVSGIVTAVPNLDASPYFRTHSYVPTGSPLWLTNGGSGQMNNTNYELRLGYNIAGNTGGIKGIRFYGAHVTVRYLF